MKIAVVDLWHSFSLSFSWTLANILAEEHDVAFVGKKNITLESSRIDVVDSGIAWPEKTSLGTLLQMITFVFNALFFRKQLKKYDVLIFSFDHPLFRFISPRASKKIICVHEYDMRQGIVSFFNNLCLKFNLSKTDALITLNDNYYNKLVKFKENVLFFEHPLFWVDQEQSLSSGDKTKFLFVGKIRKDKGLDILFKACEELEKQNQPYELTVAGSGDLTEYRYLMDKLESGLKVINRKLSDAELINFIKSTEYVVLPYKSISQSGIAYLATTLGKTIIASDLDGFQIMHERYHNCLLFEQENANDLAAKLLKVDTLREESKLKDEIDKIKRKEYQNLIVKFDQFIAELFFENREKDKIYAK